MSACLLISFSSYDVSTVNDFQLPKIKLKYISLLRRTSLVFLEDFTQDAWRWFKGAVLRTLFLFGMILYLSCLVFIWKKSLQRWRRRIYVAYQYGIGCLTGASQNKDFFFNPKKKYCQRVLNWVPLKAAKLENQEILSLVPFHLSMLCKSTFHISHQKHRRYDEPKSQVQISVEDILLNRDNQWW